jgi:hypothetical protein
VALFEADRIAQLGHRFLERLVLDGARSHKRGLGDDVKFLLRGLGTTAPGVRQPTTIATQTRKNGGPLTRW